MDEGEGEVYINLESGSNHLHSKDISELDIIYSFQYRVYTAKSGELPQCTLTTNPSPKGAFVVLVAHTSNLFHIEVSRIVVADRTGSDGVVTLSTISDLCFGCVVVLWLW